MVELSENTRRRVAATLAHGGWWGALLLTGMHVSTLGPDTPRSFGVVIVLFIGVAIAASLARSRMRLTDTITAVFQTGLEVSRQDVRALRDEVREESAAAREELSSLHERVNEINTEDVRVRNVESK